MGYLTCAGLLCLATVFPLLSCIFFFVRTLLGYRGGEGAPHHLLRNFPYDSYCADRDLPHYSLSCCIIKCPELRTLAKFDLMVFRKKSGNEGFEPMRLFR